MRMNVDVIVRIYFTHKLCTEHIVQFHIHITDVIANIVLKMKKLNVKNINHMQFHM